MTDKLKRNLKELVVAYSRCYSETLLEELRENTENLN
jgi:hypothetical protein